MVKPLLPEAEFVELFETQGATAISRHTGQNIRSVFERRNNIERKIGRALIPPQSNFGERVVVKHPQRYLLNVSDGVVLVGSDAHYWPGDNSPAHRALVKFTRDLRPEAVIMNGDAFDGASISRHPPIGWSSQPTVIDEIEACQERLAEIERAKPRKTKLVWSLGNHDARFETRIASVAPEFAKVHGVALKDHFPAWEPCWATWINPDQTDGVVVKHRFRGGMYAPANNTLWGGRTMVTGHLHSAKVIPITDYNGTRYGVDTGCLADIYGAQFRDYSEDSPRNWRSGFAVLTFKDGKLLQPELVLAWDETTVQFRGAMINV